MGDDVRLHHHARLQQSVDRIGFVRSLHNADQLLGNRMRNDCYARVRAGLLARQAGRLILDDVTFTLEGGFVTGVGRPEWGKSSLIGIALSLIEPSSSEVRVRGELATGLRPMPAPSCGDDRSQQYSSPAS